MLSRIPALTLLESYREGARYVPEEAFRRAASIVVGATLAARLEQDLSRFQDAGLDALGPGGSVEAQRAYAGFSEVAAREVVDWLGGRYDVTRELVLTQ